MNKERVGSFIKENRKKLKMKQEDLAQKLFVTAKAVSKWENGQSFPDIVMLEPLAKELDVSVSELIAGEREVTPEVTIKELATEIFQKEKTKKNLIGALIIVIGISVIAFAYVMGIFERNHYNYVCVNGFYYTFDLNSEITDKEYIGEEICTVLRTGIKQDLKNNTHGDSNAYPVGAKVYSPNKNSSRYEEQAKNGRNYQGESIIEINGKYYRGYAYFPGARDLEIFFFIKNNFLDENSIALY